jgi:hypothetical protein
LCNQIKDFAKQDNKFKPNKLLDHIDTFLVKWAFKPGANLYGVPRTKPPLTHYEFKKAIILWQKGNMPCPLP